MNAKRSDYISWQDYFMGVAILAAHRSKDPSSQVGACIVSPENKIVGIGYNGFPIGCSDELLPWAREAEDELETKYPYVCHAEMNAISNTNQADIRGATIFVTLFPCNECTKLLIQRGIGKVVYLSDKYHDSPGSQASRRMLDMVGIPYTPFEPMRDRIVIDFAAEAKAVRRV